MPTNRLAQDPALCGGQLVVSGTQVSVRAVFELLARGVSVADIVKQFPALSDDDVRAVIAYAAAIANNSVPVDVPEPAPPSDTDPDPYELDLPPAPDSDAEPSIEVDTAPDP